MCVCVYVNCVYICESRWRGECESEGEFKVEVNLGGKQVTCPRPPPHRSWIEIRGSIAEWRIDSGGGGEPREGGQFANEPLCFQLPSTFVSSLLSLSRFWFLLLLSESLFIPVYPSTLHLTYPIYPFHWNKIFFLFVGRII